MDANINHNNYGGYMSGNREGGKLAAKTNKLIHGADFYRRIGAKGGKLSRTGGFYNNPELASRLGKIGGKRSVEVRRKKSNR